MKCFNCINLDLKTYPRHSNTGYGRCKKETMKGVFESITIQRDCNKFEKIDQELLLKRVSWWDKLEVLNRGK